MAAGALGVLMIRRITALPTPDAIVHSTRSRPLASKAPPTNHVAFFYLVSFLLNFTIIMEAGREEGGQTSGVSEAQEGLEAVEKEGAGRKEEEEGKGDVREGDHGDAGGGGKLTTAVMEVKKKSGRAKKKEKRLKSEPPSLTGK